MTPEEAEPRIQEAIKQAVADGFKIRTGDFISVPSWRADSLEPPARCCPMYAYARKNPSFVYNPNARAYCIEAATGIDPIQINSFTQGFDGRQDPVAGTSKFEWYRLGARVFEWCCSEGYCLYDGR